jgi:hypothetical protein
VKHQTASCLAAARTACAPGPKQASHFFFFPLRLQGKRGRFPRANAAAQLLSPISPSPTPRNCTDLATAQHPFHAVLYPHDATPPRTPRQGSPPRPRDPGWHCSFGRAAWLVCALPAVLHCSHHPVAMHVMSVVLKGVENGEWGWRPVPRRLCHGLASEESHVHQPVTLGVRPLGPSSSAYSYTIVVRNVGVSSFTPLHF